MSDGRRSILVVDDDELFRSWARATLESEFVVFEAQGGNAALEMLEDMTPDVILTDLMMPDMWGSELCTRIRQVPELMEVPVIVMTAWGPELEDFGVQEEADLRADAMLSKPMSVDTLRREMRRWAEIGRPETRAANQERRAHPRASIDTDVKVALVTGDGLGATLAPCRMRDISEGGAFIVTTEAPLAVGERCEVWFMLPHDNEPVRCRAEVRHAHAEGNTGMGVEWEDDLADEARERIGKYVAHVLRFVRP